MSSFVPVEATVTSPAMGLSSMAAPESPNQTGYGGGYRGKRSPGRSPSGYRSRPRYYQPTPPSPEDLTYAAHLSLQYIEGLFHADNLAMDAYLRSLMDMEGYVPLLYIAQYPAIIQCGATWEGIKQKVRENSVLLEFEESNETVRLKENWSMWVPPGANHLYAKPQAQPPAPIIQPVSATTAVPLDEKETPGVALDTSNATNPTEQTPTEESS